MKKALILILGFMTIAVFLLARPGDAKAHDDCAPYISGKANNPRSGSLRGTRTVSVTIGVSSGAVLTVTVSVTIGVYDMGDGDQEEVRCDTYERWTGPGALAPR